MTRGSVESSAKQNEELVNWNLTEVDRMLLKQTDEEYEPHSWEELKWVISKWQKSSGRAQVL